MQGSKRQLLVQRETNADSGKRECRIRLLSLRFGLLLHGISEVIV